MLSYLHSFHAGNFADVLKHTILVHTLNYLTVKPKPVFYLDTHSGPGGFSLDSDEAQKNCEYRNGIGLLWEQTGLPESVNDYVECVKEFHRQHQSNSETLSHYPGSPWFAAHLLREYDRLSLCELHPREQQTLLSNFKHDRRIKIFNKDGFQSAIGAMPPKERRGLVLIDPPYEVKTDYDRVVEVLIQCHKRFATGTYAIWYPVVKRKQIEKMLDSIKNSGIRNIQVFELGLQADTEERGMTSSGMILVNPPWTLMQEMQTALPFLAEKLAGKAGVYSIRQLVEE
ncbi:23S rRNA (adenine(2030)-N(6))-methyltransferase RlmJ [Thiomicrorhabdus sp. ZW0627]|uniref:23S rRNA (adenine(2030)-N(6))-methyltransferase RlmJ n=1 Tax=Thiomicrorhabdus sp. ZW0627 TaxID=3039774 RepID=UPI002436A8FF|nr:23S rRNA (adenine(2030)-N(6))-methyltransferase RlmJ [Thiomicrorhabdus sp. ZW0627]MDG6773598.1 23S rRNA (adenine(2030)-N(6))-methyltransferase RlmJ [Thiomicrorhabdus sp. ZW0627]